MKKKASDKKSHTSHQSCWKKFKEKLFNRKNKKIETIECSFKNYDIATEFRECYCNISDSKPLNTDAPQTIIPDEDYKCPRQINYNRNYSNQEQNQKFKEQQIEPKLTIQSTENTEQLSTETQQENRTQKKSFYSKLKRNQPRSNEIGHKENMDNSKFKEIQPGPNERWRDEYMGTTEKFHSKPKVTLSGPSETGYKEKFEPKFREPETVTIGGKEREILDQKLRVPQQRYNGTEVIQRFEPEFREPLQATNSYRYLGRQRREPIEKRPHFWENHKRRARCCIHGKYPIKIPDLPVCFDDLPILRGMLSYAILWPLGCLIQDYIECGTTLANANWCRAIRFSFFGAICMAPTLHLWVVFANRYVKNDDIASAIFISLLEQVTYTPFAFVYFFFGMSILELKSVGESIAEVKQKFWPTYKTSWFYWPAVQTLNFFLIPEDMRVVAVCFFSFLWTLFLSHMKARRMNSRGPHHVYDDERGTHRVPAPCDSQRTIREDRDSDSTSSMPRRRRRRGCLRQHSQTRQRRTR